MSRVLAFDQASKTSGWAFFRNGELEKFGKFTYEDADLDARLVKIKNKVAALCEEFTPDFVIYEDIQQQDNPQVYKVLAEVYGVLSEFLEESNIPHKSVLAASWKSTVGVKGRTRAEQKRNAQKHVTDTYGIKATQDESDAICIGEHYNRTMRCAWTK